MKSIIALVVALVLPFFAHAQFLEFDDNSIASSCYKHVSSNTKFSALVGKFKMKKGPSEADSTSKFALYAQRAKPTEEERQLLAEYVTEMDKCFNRTGAVEWRKQYGEPSLIPIVNESFSIYLEMSAKLYNLEINYGQFHSMIDKELARLNGLAQSAPSNQAVGSRSQPTSSGAVDAYAVDSVRQINGAFKPQPSVTCRTFGNTTRCQ